MQPLAFALAAFVLLAACSREEQQQPAPKAKAAEAAERAIAPVLLTPDAKDVHSYAEPAEARVTHVALDLTADFDEHRLGGTATLRIQAAQGARKIVLDSRGLEILAVRNREGQPLQFALGPADPILGRPLTIQLNGADRIVIVYRTQPDAAGLLWLSPEQTAGKKLPFLFSQGESILNRSWIPTQDSPGIRQTWEARIVVPDRLKAVMSGEALTPDGEPAPNGHRAFRFRMTEPVAPYLIAIAVGDIGFKSLGKRSGVYAEPSVVDSAASEFRDTEKMIAAAEQLYGPYRWGRYDMIVLPPSFPYGGMENPRLTFLTPTLLAGDRSLVSTVAHELAHSWSGNLVTNATWNDFWLNEGFTTYFEGRIMERLYGPRRAAQEIALGWDDLQQAIADAGGPASPATQLHLNLAGQDPDRGTGEIAYQKGAIFLRTIEQAVGRERFDAWLRSYFDRFAFQPMTSARFLADLRANLVKGDEALERKLMLDAWVYRPGIPANAAKPDPKAFEAVDEASAAFAAGGPASEVPFASWSTAERLRFVNRLPRALELSRMIELDQAFRLTDSGNDELLFAWARLAIANQYEAAVPSIEHFLQSQGRRKFVQPLMKALVEQGDWGRPIAERVYAAARPSWHAVTRSAVDPLMQDAKAPAR